MVPFENSPMVSLVAIGTIDNHRILNVFRQPILPMVPMIETLVSMVSLVGPMVPLVSPAVLTVICYMSGQNPFS